MQVSITQSEQDDLVRGLQMRICVIETGSPILRAQDAVASGQPQLVRALSTEQMAVVLRHEALINKLLTAR